MTPVPARRSWPALACTLWLSCGPGSPTPPDATPNDTLTPDIVLQDASADVFMDASPTPCPNDLPAACPSPAPTWARVVPVIQHRCMPCHAVGGVAADHALDTYAHAYGLRSALLNQVYGCVMPPADAGTLSPEERATMLAWLVCHAPM